MKNKIVIADCNACHKQFDERGTIVIQGNCGEGFMHWVFCVDCMRKRILEHEEFSAPIEAPLIETVLCHACSKKYDKRGAWCQDNSIPRQYNCYKCMKEAIEPLEPFKEWLTPDN